MGPLTSIARDIEAAIASGDPGRRVDALRRMTNLFVEQAPHLKAMHVGVFDEVILRMARDIEFRARVELAGRLADLPNAPPRTVTHLAYDEDIAVAGPVIERSPRLAEDDLVAIAGTRGQEHLLALSRRPTLSERVTDVIVDRGDARVVRSVADNEGARFSDLGVAGLVARARADGVLLASLRARGDLPETARAGLVALARDQAREALRPELAGAGAALLDDAVDQAADALARAGDAPALLGDLGPAVAAVARRADVGEITEEDVSGWLREGRVAEALAGIAHIAGLPAETVARAYRSAHFDPLLFIVRSQLFGWATFKALLTCKAGRELPEAVAGNAFAAYQSLSVQTARRVVRFTAVREGASPVP
jgi:uncharacterized protein (DUF2336 family)